MAPQIGLVDSLVRIGGWSLPTQRGREDALSDSPREFGGGISRPRRRWLTPQKALVGIGTAPTRGVPFVNLATDWTIAAC
jgi:hypothetical protein